MAIRAAVKGQLAKRAPGLERKVSEARWRARNRTRSYKPADAVELGLKSFVADFTRDGIAIGTVDQLFGSRGIYEDAAREATQLLEVHEASNPEVNPRKPYLANLFHEALPLDHPFGRIALHPNVLEVAKRYLGMRPFLRSVSVWLTKPTPGPAIETQLWHRDGDDLMQVKLFLPFTKVTLAAGPFCYAPGTQLHGSRHQPVAGDENGRSTDDQLRVLVPESEWRVCVGDPGMVVFADTCGYHKQIKPESDERLLLMVQYTSGTPTWPRDLALDYAATDLEALSVDQRFAVEPDAA
jgi:Phytanoyl-CoA dioxygenase (PhyH)